MTNRERLYAMIGFQPGEHSAEAALLDNGDLDPGEPYKPENLPFVRSAAIMVLETLLSTPNTSSQQTGFTVSYDRQAVLKRLEMLKKEAGTGSNRVTFIRPW